jgi:hypothetical protein
MRKIIGLNTKYAYYLLGSAVEGCLRGDDAPQEPLLLEINSFKVIDITINRDGLIGVNIGATSTYGYMLKLENPVNPDNVVFRFVKDNEVTHVDFVEVKNDKQTKEINPEVV